MSSAQTHITDTFVVYKYICKCLTSEPRQAQTVAMKYKLPPLDDARLELQLPRRILVKLAAIAGIPYETLRKAVSGESAEPRYDTIQKALNALHKVPKE